MSEAVQTLQQFPEAAQKTGSKGKLRRGLKRAALGLALLGTTATAADFARYCGGDA